MRIAPGPPTAGDIATIGKYFWTLWSDPSWLLRRVETVRLVDADRTERRITLDVDVEAIGAIADSVGLPPDDTVLVPLALLEKGLQLDLDVRSDTNQSLSLLTSEQDSRLSAAAMGLALERALSTHPAIEPVFAAQLYAISRHTPSDLEIKQMTGEFPGPVESWTLDGTVLGAIRDAWQDAFRNEAFRGMVATFTVNYAPTTRLSRATPLQVVKFRYVGSGAIPNRGIGAWLDFTPSTYAISAPSVGRAAREHLRILAPEGTFLTQISLVKESPRSSGALGPSQGASTYDARVSLERGALYSSGIARDDGIYTAGATLRPSLRGLGLPALLTIALASILIGGGSLIQFSQHLLTKHSSEAEPVIALFGVLFSVYSIYLSRQGEHEIRSQLLLLPRILILSTVLPVWGAAVVFIFGREVLVDALGWIWAAVAAYCLLITVYLIVVLARSRSSESGVRNASEQTRIYPLYTIIRPAWDWQDAGPKS